MKLLNLILPVSGFVLTAPFGFSLTDFGDVDRHHEISDGLGSLGAPAVVSEESRLCLALRAIAADASVADVEAETLWVFNAGEAVEVLVRAKDYSIFDGRVLVEATCAEGVPVGWFRLSLEAAGLEPVLVGAQSVTGWLPFARAAELSRSRGWSMCAQFVSRLEIWA